MIGIARNGANAAVFTATGSAAIDVAGVEQLVVEGGAGNDTIVGQNGIGTLTQLTLDGGTGNDTLRGGDGNDILLGGSGNDFVDGNIGSDTVNLGSGDDVFGWDPGDGSDVVEGQAGADELRFNGSNANENIVISPNGGRVTFQRDVAAVLMDMDDVETITYNAIGGSDNILISNLAGTDVTRVIVNLAASGGGGDGFADTVTINATTLGDILDIAATSSSIVTVTGLFTTVEIRNFEAIDRLIINAGDGNDTIDATGAALSLTIFGGIGDDTMTGGTGRDQFFTGAGLNTVFWSPGPDFIDSTGGTATVFI
jgi:Ca2+-binding RTX toxin-like protein